MPYISASHNSSYSNSFLNRLIGTLQRSTPIIFFFYLSMLFEPIDYPLLMHARKNLKNENEVVEADNVDGNPIASIARRQEPYDAAAATTTTAHYQHGFPRVASIPTMFDALNFGGMMPINAPNDAIPIDSMAAVAGAAAFPSSSPPPPKPSFLAFRNPPMMAPIIQPMTPLDPHFTPGEFDGK